MYIKDEEKYIDQAFEILKKPLAQRGVLLLGIESELKAAILQIGKLYCKIESNDNL